ncbi:MAG: 50S ribosomal protein L14 [candidate division SR1 bacterium]|nr:50S ribosomal protein L14 [candidate division SR1 bacterium]
MLKNESNVIITDNTGAKKGQIFRILKGSNAKTATIGDRVMIAIKDALPTSAIKKGTIAMAMIVRVKKELPRKDGTYVRFGDNAVIIMSKDAKGEIKPVGKRIFGPVAKELRQLGHKAITNMAEEVV